MRLRSRAPKARAYQSAATAASGTTQVDAELHRAATYAASARRVLYV